MSELPASSNETGWLHDIQVEVAEHHRLGDYRPVAVAIIQNPKDEVLLLQSAKPRGEWMFPQGGIDVGEPVLDALTREVFEETGISPAELKLITYRDRQCLDAEPGKTDTRGYSHGKAYYFFDARYAGTSPLTLQADEIAACAWVHPFDMEEALQSTRPEKREMMLKFLLGY